MHHARRAVLGARARRVERLWTTGRGRGVRVLVLIVLVRIYNFSVNVIPHTLSKTIFSEYKIGTKVNIEIDLVARYLEKLVVK